MAEFLTDEMIANILKQQQSNTRLENTLKRKNKLLIKLLDKVERWEGDNQYLQFDEEYMKLKKLLLD